MSLRVAFDMDGTVADMHVVLRQERERLFGPAAPRETQAPESASATVPPHAPAAAGSTATPAVDSTIDVATEPGKGTAFTVRLPVPA